MKFRSRFVALCAVVLASACGSPSGPTRETPRVIEEEPGQLPVEGKLELPAYPQTADLVEFYPLALGGHRYFIDVKTLTVGGDRIVRYAVVVRTSGGATNVSFEGIRCQTREKRLYATGYAGKGWVEARRSDWELIRGGRINEHQAFLYTEYFCPYGPEPADKGTIVSAIRRGLQGPSNRRSDP